MQPDHGMSLWKSMGMGLAESGRAFQAADSSPVTGFDAHLHPQTLSDRTWLWITGTGPSDSVRQMDFVGVKLLAMMPTVNKPRFARSYYLHQSQ